MTKNFGQLPISAGTETAVHRDPFMAAALSVIPGLGQMYTGQSAKGLLFIDVAVINFLLMWLILFTEPIVKTLTACAHELHVNPNVDLMHAIKQLHFGSPASLAVLVLCFGFMVYAARDAYDVARARRLRAIYSDTVIGMPEATSGSYLVHAASMVAFAIVAMFFLIPPPPLKQVTMIEFVEPSETPAKPTVHTTKRAVTPSRADAQQDKAHPPTPAQHKRSPQSVQQQTQPAHQAPATQPSAAKPPATEAAKPPIPTPVRPVVHNMPAPPVVAPAPLLSHQVTAPMHNPMPTPTQTHTLATPALPALLNPAANQQQPAMVAPSKIAYNPGGPSLPNLPSASNRTAIPGAPVAPGPLAGPTTQGNDKNMPQPAAARSNGPTSDSQTANVPGPSKAIGTGHNKLIAVNPSVGDNDKHASSPATPGRDATDTPARSDTSTHTTGKNIDAEVDIDYSRFMAELQRRIKHNWFPPRTPASNRVVMAFTVALTGEISNLRLVRSSGQSVIDIAARHAIEMAAPLPHLPAGAKHEADIEFTFDYNVFGGGQRGNVAF